MALFLNMVEDAPEFVFICVGSDNTTQLHDNTEIENTIYNSFSANTEYR